MRRNTSTAGTPRSGAGTPNRYLDNTNQQSIKYAKQQQQHSRQTSTTQSVLERAKSVLRDSMRGSSRDDAGGSRSLSSSVASTPPRMASSSTLTGPRGTSGLRTSSLRYSGAVDVSDGDDNAVSIDGDELDEDASLDIGSEDADSDEEELRAYLKSLETVSAKPPVPPRAKSSVKASTNTYNKQKAKSQTGDQSRAATDVVSARSFAAKLSDTASSSTVSAYLKKVPPKPVVAPESSESNTTKNKTTFNTSITTAVPKYVSRSAVGELESDPEIDPSLEYEVSDDDDDIRMSIMIGKSGKRVSLVEARPSQPASGHNIPESEAGEQVPSTQKDRTTVGSPSRDSTTSIGSDFEEFLNRRSSVGAGSFQAFSSPRNTASRSGAHLLQGPPAAAMTRSSDILAQTAVPESSAVTSAVQDKVVGLGLLATQEPQIQPPPQSQQSVPVVAVTTPIPPKTDEQPQIATQLPTSKQFMSQSIDSHVSESISELIQEDVASESIASEIRSKSSVADRSLLSVVDDWSAEHVDQTTAGLPINPNDELFAATTARTSAVLADAPPELKTRSRASSAAPATTANGTRRQDADHKSAAPSDNGPKPTSQTQQQQQQFTADPGVPFGMPHVGFGGGAAATGSAFPPNSAAGYNPHAMMPPMPYPYPYPYPFYNPYYLSQLRPQTNTQPQEAMQHVCSECKCAHSTSPESKQRVPKAHDLKSQQHQKAKHALDQIDRLIERSEMATQGARETNDEESGGSASGSASVSVSHSGSAATTESSSNLNRLAQSDLKTIRERTSYYPNLVIMDNFVKNHLELLQDFVQMNVQMVESQTYRTMHYTTLQDTRAFIEKHRPSVISLEEAVKLVKEDNGELPASSLLMQ